MAELVDATDLKVRGYDGIGRHVGLKTRWLLTVRVQVSLSPFINTWLTFQVEHVRPEKRSRLNACIEMRSAECPISPNHQSTLPIDD